MTDRQRKEDEAKSLAMLDRRKYRQELERRIEALLELLENKTAVEQDRVMLELRQRLQRGFATAS